MVWVNTQTVITKRAPISGVVLASVVGKGVAEESMTSYLIVVCLLLNIMKEERIKGGKAGSGGAGKPLEELKASELDEKRSPLVGTCGECHGCFV